MRSAFTLPALPPAPERTVTGPPPRRSVWRIRADGITHPYP
ncbi:hypothetical protein [Cryptosporangium japonicum]